MENGRLWERAWRTVWNTTQVSQNAPKIHNQTSQVNRFSFLPHLASVSASMQSSEAAAHRRLMLLGKQPKPFCKWEIFWMVSKKILKRWNSFCSCSWKSLKSLQYYDAANHERKVFNKSVCHINEWVLVWNSGVTRSVSMSKNYASY